MAHQTEGSKKRRRVIRSLALGGGSRWISGICDMCIMRYLLVSSLTGRGLTYDSDKYTNHVDFCQLIAEYNCGYRDSSDFFEDPSD